ncbi:MAG: hypothetical protein U0R44_02980 [Candidatus Micrarchaeia archaeon]
MEIRHGSMAGKAADAETPATGRMFFRKNGLKEGILAAAVFGAGCAHLHPPLAPPIGQVSAYALGGEQAMERVAVGGEIDVVLRATVHINDGRTQEHLVDYEKRHGQQDLTYCWFVFQDIGVTDENGPVYFLLNPRYRDPGEQRYIGALKSYSVMTDTPSPPFEAVVPVEKEGVMTYNDQWIIAPFPKSREDALFYIQPGTFVPQVDGLLLRNLGVFCRETVAPDYAVAEYGPTFASLLIYPGRR